ncbi:MAG TPA: hypothetical protein VKS24_25015 [Bradyrhizobium sp.]|nr:hypothetical protein [Bradyrhizobium sp.]
MAWSRMIDMELDDEDKVETMCPPALENVPDYPWGLRITLTHRELEKLGLDDDCSVGDVIDLRAFARVCSISSNETAMGPECRIELQITQLAVENEMDEEDMPG